MRILLTLISVIAYLFILTSAENECFTPDNISGTCISLRECEPLFEKVLRYNKLSLSEQQHIRQSQCGVSGKVPRVCCPQTTSRFRESDLQAHGECGTNMLQRSSTPSGDTTSIFEFPWTALIQYSRDNGAKEFLCSGTLINKDYILTGARCVMGPLRRMGWQPHMIRLGEHNLQTNPDCEGDGECADPMVEIPIRQTIVHDGYNSNPNSSKMSHNDIALIRLSRSVSFTDFIRPICLPFALEMRNKIFDQTHLETVILKLIDNGKSIVRHRQNFIGLELDKCNTLYGRMANRTLDSKQMCVKLEDGFDSCGSGSGDALMYEDRSTPGHQFTYLVGVLSFERNVCSRSGLPSVYTRIDQYLDWILENMRK